MARMIPQTLPFDAPGSEQRVFELLRDGPGTDDWTVIWSYRPAQLELESRRRREVDFLILIPRAGIICLEVKGGQFEIRDGSWYPAGASKSIVSPDRQSEQAMFALRNDLVRQFQREPNVLSAPMNFAVATTDWTWPHDLRRPTPLIFDEAVVDAPGLLARNLLEAARQLRTPVDPHRRRPSRLTEDTIARLMDFLAPNYRLVAGPQLERISEQLIRLTQEQFIVLDMFGENERCLVKGMAGTGKTMLALEFAKRSAHGHPRVGLLCFNLLLGNFLRGQAEGHSKITAGGFWPDIIRPIIAGSPHGDEFRRDEENASNETELYGEVYPHYAHLALEKSGPQFDILVVDEAADLSVSPYLELMDQLLVGGLSEGRWVMFGDFSNQAIFPGTEQGAEDALVQYRPARVNLRVNCRNALPIARDTALLAEADMLETRQIEGPRPEYLYWNYPDDLSGLLDEQVHRLLNDGVRIEEMVVLSEHRLDDSGLDFGRTYGGHFLVTYVRGEPSEADDGTPRLKFCSIPSFKGMESEVVILILGRLFENAIESTRPFDQQNARAYAYIGMSRARGALVVLAQEDLREEVESRLGD